MQPVLTPDEMAAVDAAAPVPIAELIDRAGRAVAREALDLLGGSYGRVVRVIVGKGNNGNDGRVAAEVLQQRGVQVELIDAAASPGRTAVLRPADLVIDAAYGTGFRDGSWSPPDVGTTPVLAVDVPSGLDALDGSTTGDVLAAVRTITFHALKPGLLLGAGPRLAGRVCVTDIGLGAHATHCHVVERADVASWWPQRERDAHKWKGAVRVVAGSVGMTGAGVLCADAAARAGSGLVKASAVDAVAGTRAEVMEHPLTGDDWSVDVLDDVERFGAIAIGPGLGRRSSTLAGVRSVLDGASIPAVVDGDGLFALTSGDGDGADARALLGGRRAATVLTPHDGEFRHLTGALPATDRIAATRSLAADLGCVVLLKGPTTVVADAAGEVLLIDHGDQRLATAGAGDVLTGIIAAALAAGIAPLRAAAAGAWLHAEAGAVQQPWGLLAGDLVHALPRALAGLRSPDGPGVDDDEHDGTDMTAP